MEAVSKPVNSMPVPSKILAVLMVVIVEMMFFGGLISAYVLASAGQTDWPPANQPRLPIPVTFGNMILLLLSLIPLWQFIKYIRKGELKKSLWLTVMLMGTVFFIVQGYEWFRILLFGMHAGRGLFSSFFYTLIGVHGFHVFAGLVLMRFVYRRLGSAISIEEKRSDAEMAGLFWTFVVLLWPVLYYLTYWV